MVWVGGLGQYRVWGGVMGGVHTCMQPCTPMHSIGPEEDIGWSALSLST